MRRLSLLGIIVGGIIDVVATTILAVPVMVVAAARANVEQLPKAEQAKAVLAMMHASPGLQISGWILGGLCSVLGGYVAARIADREELLNGTLSAYLCTAMGIYALARGSSTMPLWQHVVALVASPALAALGGYLRARQIGRGYSPPMLSPVPA